jgi:hypothetical protein
MSCIREALDIGFTTFSRHLCRARGQRWAIRPLAWWLDGSSRPWTKAPSV